MKIMMNSILLLGMIGALIFSAETEKEKKVIKKVYSASDFSGMEEIKELLKDMDIQIDDSTMVVTIMVSTEGDKGESEIKIEKLLRSEDINLLDVEALLKDLEIEISDDSEIKVIMKSSGGESDDKKRSAVFFSDDGINPVMLEKEHVIIIDGEHDFDFLKDLNGELDASELEELHMILGQAQEGQCRKSKDGLKWIQEGREGEINFEDIFIDMDEDGNEKHIMVKIIGDQDGDREEIFFFDSDSKNGDYDNVWLSDEKPRIQKKRIVCETGASCCPGDETCFIGEKKNNRVKFRGNPRGQRGHHQGFGFGLETQWVDFDFSDLNDFITAFGFDPIAKDGVLFIGGRGYGSIGNGWSLGGLGAGFKTDQNLNMGSFSRHLSVESGYGGMTITKRLPVNRKLTFETEVLLGGGSTTIEISDVRDNPSFDDPTGNLTDMDHFKFEREYLIVRPSLSALVHISPWLGIRGGVSYMGTFGGHWKSVPFGYYVDGNSPDVPNGLDLSLGLWLGM